MTNKKSVAGKSSSGEVGYLVERLRVLNPVSTCRARCLMRIPC